MAEVKCPHCGKDFDPNLLIQDEPTREKQAEEIYGLYPRKLGRLAGIRAIMRALKKTSYQELKRVTSAMALAWDNHDLTYCPHAATFFNQERYRDPVETWAPTKKPDKPNGPPVWKQCEALRSAIDCHLANSNWVGYDARKVTDAMRLDLKAKRAKLAELEQQRLVNI